MLAKNIDKEVVTQNSFVTFVISRPNCVYLNCSIIVVSQELHKVPHFLIAFQFQNKV